MATYYIDSQDGNDSNSGLSEILAWKTITKVNASSFSAGDSILFKKGLSYTGGIVVSNSGSSGSIITYGAYGSGERPIITSPASSRSFDIRGKSYVSVIGLEFKNAITQSVLFYNGLSNITLNNVKMSSSTTGIEVGPGTYNDITIYNCELGLTGTNSFSGEASAIFNNLTFSGSSLGGLLLILSSSSSHCTNLTIESCTLKGMQITYVDTLTISNTINNNNNYGFYLSYITSLSISNSESSYNMYHGAYIGNSSNVNINDCHFDYNYNNTSYNGVSCYGTSIGVNITGTTASHNAGDGFNFHNVCTEVVISNCIGNNNGTTGGGADGDGISFHETCSGIVKRSMFINNLKSAMSDVQSANVEYYYNVFGHDSIGTLGLVNCMASTGIDYLYNNVIYSLGVLGNGIEITGIATIKNNIIIGFNNGIHYTSGTVIEDYNCAYGFSTSGFSGLTEGAHSITSDPKFRSATDFHLIATSPCINAGTDVGLTTDFDGMTVPGPGHANPCIGAYEFYGGGSGGAGCGLSMTMKM